MTVSVLDHAPAADGITPDTAAFQRAVDEVGAAGGGTLTVPPGRYLLGGVILRSGVHLHLEAGAVLVASPHYADFATHESLSEAESSRHALLYARDADHVTITGPGRIEGNGVAYAAVTPDEHGYRAPADQRPRIVLLEGCRDVRVEGLHVHDAPMWGIHLVACDRAVLRALVLDNSMTLPNTDGIDIDSCTDVVIDGCVIRGADDAICLKTTRKPAPYQRPTRGVVITGCTLASRSCALKIGTETHEAIEQVVATGLVIAPTNRAIGIVSRDGGPVRDVIVSDVTMRTEMAPASFWGRAEPVHISALPRHPDREPGVVERVVVRGLRGVCQGPIHVHAWDPEAVRDVLLDDVVLRQEASSSPGQGELDLRPPVRPDVAEGGGLDNAYHVGADGMWGVTRPAAGMAGVEITGTSGVELREVRIRRPEPLPQGWSPEAVRFSPL